jgi:pilus assembly protein CpaE
MEGSTRHLWDQPLTALLIAPDRALARQLTAAVQETRAFQLLADMKSYPPPNTLEIRLRQIKPDVILLDVSTSLDGALELIRFASSLRPITPIIAFHHTRDSATVITALRAGASEFLYAPFDAGSQRDAVSRIRRLRHAEPDTPPELGKVVVFSAAKPGAGSSTLALHTAHAIRKRTSRRVLLIDFDLQSGSISFYLKLQPHHSVLDALAKVDRLDAVLWGSLVESRGGIDVLPAPETPFSQPVEQPRFNDLIEYARRAYDWIVLDTPTIFHRTSLLSVSESDQALIVSTADLASLHMARRAVTALKQLGFSRDRYQIVVNRLDRKSSLAAGDLSRLFDCPVPACIPNDYFTLHRLISLGEPLLPDCDLGRSINSLAAHIAGAADTAKTAVSQPESRLAPARTLEERA